MAKKIYKLCLVRGYTEAYYQLSAEKKTAADGRPLRGRRQGRSENGNALLPLPLGERQV